MNDCRILISFVLDHWKCFTCNYNIYNFLRIYKIRVLSRLPHRLQPALLVDFFPPTLSSFPMSASHFKPRCEEGQKYDSSYNSESHFPYQLLYKWEALGKKQRSYPLSSNVSHHSTKNLAFWNGYSYFIAMSQIILNKDYVRNSSNLNLSSNEIQLRPLPANVYL